MKAIYVYLLPFLFLCVACENIILYNPMDDRPDLVMNALINGDSLSGTVYLHLTGHPSIRPVNDADIRLYINGEWKENLTLASEQNSLSGAYNFHSPLLAGDVVKLIATTKDGQQVWSETTVPTPATILSMDTSTVFMRTYDFPLREYYQYKIKIKDRPNEKNYYRLLMQEVHTIKGISQATGNDTTDIYSNYYYRSWQDVVLTDGSPISSEDQSLGFLPQTENLCGVFDDSRFTDGEYTLTVHVDKYRLSNNYYPWLSSSYYSRVDVRARLLSISEAEYRYLRALNLHDSDNYNPTLSEPVQFPSNVKGGYGMVGISKEVSSHLKLCENW